MGKRKLRDEDIDLFITASEVRKKNRSHDDVIAELTRRNPWRMWRIRNDFKWLQRQFKRMGYNPEDARWIL